MLKEGRRETWKHREHTEMEQMTETGKDTQLKTESEPWEDLAEEDTEIQSSED